MKDSTIEVRDRREPGFFTIDNEVIENYPELTAYGIVVYAVMCKYSRNEDQKIVIKLDTLAEKCRMSRSTVKLAIQNCADQGLIFVETRYHAPSIYVLLRVEKGSSHTTTSGSRVATTEVVVQRPQLKTNYKTKTTTPPVGDGEDSISSEEKDSPRARVRRVFAYYLEKLGRRPTQYELSPKRMRIGLARLEECKRKCGGDYGKAEQLMCVVVDALSESEFHKGKNDRNKPFIDWINHLFKDTEKLDWWLDQLGVA